MEKANTHNFSLMLAASHILQQIGKKIKELFRLEEVEVTFTEGGYTYTKVPHKP